MLIRDIRDALVIREGDIFLLTDTAGNVHANNPNGFGLYHGDTRYLSVYDFSFADARPVMLLSTAELGFSEEQVLTNPTMLSDDGRVLPRGSLELRRQRVVDGALEETLQVTNYNVFPVSFDVVYRLGADFADIFEVRGSERKQRGELLPTHVEDGHVVFSYKGLDGRKRETIVSFSPQPASVDEGQVTFHFALEHRQSAAVRLLFAIDGHLKAPEGSRAFRAPHESVPHLDGKRHPHAHGQRVLQRSAGALLARPSHALAPGERPLLPRRRHPLVRHHLRPRHGHRLHADAGLQPGHRAPLPEDAGLLAGHQVRRLAGRRAGQDPPRAQGRRDDGHRRATLLPLLRQHRLHAPLPPAGRRVLRLDSRPGRSCARSSPACAPRSSGWTPTATRTVAAIWSTRSGRPPGS